MSFKNALAILGLAVLVGVNGQRLTMTVTPLSYDLVLLPILTGQNPRLCGHVSIDVEARNATNVIHFHGDNLEILDISFESLPASSTTTEDGRIRSGTYLQRLERVEELCFAQTQMPPPLSAPSRDGTVRMLSQKAERTEWTAVLARTMVPGARYRLGVQYIGQVYNVSKGFFRTKHEPGNPEHPCCDKWVAVFKIQFIKKRIYSFLYHHQVLFRSYSNAARLRPSSPALFR